HPMHTEAVAYISGRADMMSAAFMFAGLYFALAEGPRRVLGGVLSAVCFIAALMCKESSTMFPLLLALLVSYRAFERGGEEPLAKKLAHYALPLAAAVSILIAYILLRLTVLHFADAGGANETGFVDRLL